MSIFAPSRCVLLLSDEGLDIYDVGSSRSVLVENVPWNTEDFTDAVAETVQKKCRGKHILILNDMVEQHYRKERIPKVSPFDKANVLKRRVAAAFPSYPIRSAIKMKERAPTRDNQLSSEIYLFAAVPFSENVRKTLDAVKKCYASIAGFCLLPVESATMVHALSKKLIRSGEKQSVWTLFVGQHQSGGLRQIVTKNGELALTRMTPIVDTDIDHEVWASEVAGEIKGTMGYLSRFGFDPTDGLDVVVIANNSLADNVSSKIDFECNLSVLTSMEAANLLGLKIGRQEEERYADPLHVAWSGKKSSLTLPLRAMQLDTISGPAKMAAAASFVLLLACGYFAWQAYNGLSGWVGANEELDRARQENAATKIEHQQEVAKKEAMGVDFLLIENSTKVYDKFEHEAMKPLRVFDVIGRSLGSDLRLTSLDVRPAAEAPVAAVPGAAVDPNAPLPNRRYEIVLRIVFPAALAPEVGVTEINSLEERLKQNLPNHQVSIIKQVADLSYTGNFVGEATSQKDSGKEKKDYEAQIVIRGELI